MGFSDIFDFFDAKDKAKEVFKNFVDKKKLDEKIEQLWNNQSDSFSSNVSKNDVREKFEALLKRNESYLIGVIAYGNDAVQRERVNKSIERELSEKFPNDKDRVIQIWKNFRDIVVDAFQENISVEDGVVANRIENNIIGVLIQRLKELQENNQKIAQETNTKFDSGIDSVTNELNEIKSEIQQMIQALQSQCVGGADRFLDKINNLYY